MDDLPVFLQNYSHAFKWAGFGTNQHVESFLVFLCWVFSLREKWTFSTPAIYLDTDGLVTNVLSKNHFFVNAKHATEAMVEIRDNLALENASFKLYDTEFIMPDFECSLLQSRLYN